MSMIARKVYPLLLILPLLVACSLPQPGLRLPESPTPSPTPTSTITPGYTNCGWNWATQALPELSAQVQSALEAAGLEGVEAHAEAFGENCFSSVTGEVLYFATMQTDFRLTVSVDSLADEEAMGARLEQILTVLDGFPAGSMAGPNPGNVGIRFLAGSDELNLWFTVTYGEAARAQGLHGAELLEELANR